MIDSDMRKWNSAVKTWLENLLVMNYWRWKQIGVWYQHKKLIHFLNEIFTTYPASSEVKLNTLIKTANVMKLNMLHSLIFTGRYGNWEKNFASYQGELLVKPSRE